MQPSCRLQVGISASTLLVSWRHRELSTEYQPQFLMRLLGILCVSLLIQNYHHHCTDCDLMLLGAACVATTIMQYVTSIQNHECGSRRTSAYFMSPDLMCRELQHDRHFRQYLCECTGELAAERWSSNVSLYAVCYNTMSRACGWSSGSVQLPVWCL